jgi:hypothetical protein
VAWRSVPAEVQLAVIDWKFNLTNSNNRLPVAVRGAGFRTGVYVPCSQRSDQNPGVDFPGLRFWPATRVSWWEGLVTPAIGNPQVFLKFERSSPYRPRSPHLTTPGYPFRSLEYPNG